jgi:alkylated DNA repair protein alkB family protein 6
LTNNNTLLASPLPSWLVSPIITPHFDRLALFAGSPHRAPNHVLVNEYTPGQGIMPHEDGAAYYPLVATVSLGGDIVLDLYEKFKRDDDEKNGHEDTGNNDDGDDSSSDKPITKEEFVAKEGRGGRQPKYRILQERRSLLVTRNSIYRDYLHGIAERYRDEGLGPDSICNWDLLGHPERLRDGANARETRISLTYRDVLKVAKLGNTMKFLNKR